jgi:hypothetical protein
LVYLLLLESVAHLIIYACVYCLARRYVIYPRTIDNTPSVDRNAGRKASRNQNMQITHM